MFGAIALMLAAMGLFGVLAYQVNQRRREIAVRLVLGAQPGSVEAGVLRESVALLSEIMCLRRRSFGRRALSEIMCLRRRSFGHMISYISVQLTSTILNETGVRGVRFERLAPVTGRES